MKELNILAVDDEPITLRIMQVLLSKYGKCQVAATGSEAIRFVKSAINLKEYFDLITIDIQIPDKNGIEILEEIVTYERLNSVRAVKFMVSVHGTQENIMKAIKRRCDDFLVKPVNGSILEKKLKKFELIN